MLKEIVVLFAGLVALSSAYPAQEAVVVHPEGLTGDISKAEPLESLEGAESAYPQWGHRGYGYGGYGHGGYGHGGYGHGHGGYGHGGYGHGGYGHGGYGHRGWGR